MGQVITLTILFVIVVFVLGGGIYFVVGVNKAQRPEVDSPSYINHLAMARWIENTLDDDMIRPIIASDDQQTARKLLAIFYKEHNSD